MNLDSYFAVYLTQKQLIKIADSKHRITIDMEQLKTFKNQT